MLQDKVLNAINDQIEKEMFAANLYLSMAAYFEDKNYTGFAHWMRLQSQEEITHAMKMFNYILDRGSKPIIGQIDKPKSDWNNPLEVFQEAYEHEKKVTAWINEVYELAISEKDYATQSFLKWFIDEQVEEEATASEIVERLDMVKDNSGLLFMLDRELGTRTLDA